ncbi:hypothetical protein [Macrococcoides canis]|uniref:Uncharacterized protein n=1 Tax=Macrococcoides canis TaxID=1855823 RepID=A0A4R6C6S6_9STAP|nr:hypothetical protein [Macrococcus canis]TDM18146.1 hypothetical protein ETI04_01250 [Macrococcus canis]TDM32744.1 hypothetical protein ETI03_03320 [Macrococcus canis]
MKNKYMTVLFVVIAIFVTSLITVFALSVIQPGSTIEAIAIPISFLNIFATGYGAYLGAKISGENATQLMKNELIMSDFKEHKKEDMRFLNKFSEIVNKYKLNSEIDISNFSQHIISTLNADRELNKVKTDLVDTSQIIRYPTEFFIQDFETCRTSAAMLNNRLNGYVKNYIEIDLNIEKNNYLINIHDVTFHGLCDVYRLGHRKTEIKVTVHEKLTKLEDYPGKFLEGFSHKIDIGEMIDYIIDQNKDEINKFIKQLNNNRLILKQLKFKNEGDLRLHILNYYEID